MGEVAVLAVAQVHPARVLARHDNGSITVEMPVCAASTIDTARTAGKGTGSLTITRDDLAQMAANIAEWPGPIPIHPEPHRPFDATGGPAPGFLEALEVRGDVLWGRFTLTGELARQFEAGQWRGFSVDIARDPQMPSKKLTGWAVWGGVLTNRPAAPVNFSVEVAAAIGAAELCVVQMALSRDEAESKGARMSTESGLSLEAKLTIAEQDKAALTAQIAGLSAKLADRDGQVAALVSDKDKLALEAATLRSDAEKVKADLQVATTKSAALEAELAQAKTKLATIEAASLESKVTAIATKAIKRGVLPALFDGVEKDPVAWFKSKFASLEAFEQFADALPATEKKSLSSGHNVSDDIDSLPADRVRNLKTLGLDPKYALVTNSNDLK